MGGDPASTPIATDRPAVAASSVVVPEGSLQFENGFASTLSVGQYTLDGPETSVRFGLAAKTELRLGVPNYFGQPGLTSGFGDLSIGMKQQLGPAAGFDVSLIFTLSLPSGSQAFSSGGYDPSVQLPWSRQIASNWTIGGMLSIYWPTQMGARNVTGEGTAFLDRQLTKRWDAFIEYAGDFPERGGPRNLLHFGTAFKPTPLQQIDAHIGIGLSSAEYDRLIGIGYSFRVQIRHK